MTNLNCQMLGCLLIALARPLLNECSAETPPELLAIVNRWKSSCFGKEFEATGLATRAVDDLQKSPFDGRNERELYTSRSSIRFYENGMVLQGLEVNPGDTFAGKIPGTATWLNGRTTFHQVDTIKKDDVSVVDLPDPHGIMFPSPNVGILAGFGVVRNTMIDDFLRSYKTWESPKSNLSPKLFRGRSDNGFIEVVVETKTHPVITQLRGSIRFDRQSDGLPIKIEYAVFLEYTNNPPFESIPSFAESRQITTGKGFDHRFATRITLSSGIASADPLTTLSDGLPYIANGTRVQVNDHPGIDFEWRDGEIVRKIDRKKVASLLGFKFSGIKWLLPGVLLLLTGTIGFVWWRRSQS